MCREEKCSSTLSWNSANILLTGSRLSQFDSLKCKLETWLKLKIKTRCNCDPEGRCHDNRTTKHRTATVQHSYPPAPHGLDKYRHLHEFSLNVHDITSFVIAFTEVQNHIVSSDDNLSRR